MSKLNPIRSSVISNMLIHTIDLHSLPIKSSSARTELELHIPVSKLHNLIASRCHTNRREFNCVQVTLDVAGQTYCLPFYWVTQCEMRL